MVRRDTIAARRRGGTADDRDRRRRQIVEAAVRAVEAHGADAGLGLVADEAGLPRPHVYRHFTGKGELDQEVARHVAGLLSDWIRPSLTAPGPAPAVIRGVVDRVLAWAVEHPHLYRFRARHVTPAAVGELGDAVAGYLGAAARPPDHVVAGVIGLVDGGIIWWLDHRAGLGAGALAGWLAAQVGLVLAGVSNEGSGRLAGRGTTRPASTYGIDQAMFTSEHMK